MKLKQLETIRECPIKATLRYETEASSFDVSGQKNQLIKDSTFTFFRYIIKGINTCELGSNYEKEKKKTL